MNMKSFPILFMKFNLYNSYSTVVTMYQKVDTMKSVSMFQTFRQLNIYLIFYYLGPYFNTSQKFNLYKLDMCLRNTDAPSVNKV